MPRYRITKAVPRQQPYEPGQVVNVPPGNRSIWRGRKWAKELPEVETATARRPQREVAARRVGNSAWYEIIKDGEVVEKALGEDAKNEALRRLG